MARGQFANFKSVWWRGEVSLKNGEIRPNKENLSAYNPFEFYWPLEKSSREHQSLPYLFSDVDCNDTEAVVGFCQRFGVLGDPYPHTNPTNDFSAWLNSRLKYPTFDEVNNARARKLFNKSIRDWDINDFKAAIDVTVIGQPAKKSLCVPLPIKNFSLSKEKVKGVIEQIQRANTTNQ